MTDRGAGRLVQVAALVVAACGVGGCSSEGSPASPNFQGGPVLDASVVSTDGGDGGEGGDAGYAICPPGLDASFSDLLNTVMATQASCGTSMTYSCHSPTGATMKGSDNLLNLALADSGVEGGLDPAAIYAELVNHASWNSQCTDKPSSVCQSILRVAPGDAGASLLYIKLTLTTLSNPHYGEGMPLGAPGSICPEALGAFRDWIDQGAKMN